MAEQKHTEEFFEQMRRRFRLAEEALEDIHREALEDWKHRVGGDENVWDAKMLSERRDEGRPVFSINRAPQFLRQVTGAQKKSRPAIQVSPIGDGADEETAKIEQGLVRHIERTSDAEEAYDTAFEHMLTGGFGFIALKTDYVDSESFDQEIKFERVANPFAEYPDPRAKKRDYSDAKFWFTIEDMDADDYKEEYGDSTLAGLSDWGGAASQAPGWIQSNSVRVAEYYWVEETVEIQKKGQREREKTKRSVHWIKTNGVEVLDETDIPGEYIPRIPVLGEEIVLNGVRHLIGLVRYARTPQSLYNLWTSALAEAIALAPKAPYLVTPAQIEGFEDIWERANSSNLPYIPVNPDPKAPGWPQRQNLEPAIVAISQALAHADNDLKATYGMYDASLGKPGPEQSGKAILLRQQQGEESTYGFQDALAPAIKHAGRIIAGWIPAYYDAARVVRIVNPDGTSRTIPINQPFQDDDGLQKVFDLTAGKYDVAVSMGKSYAAAREEAADAIMQLVSAQPALMQVVGDLLVKNFDWPMADEIAARLKKMLPPQLQDQGQQNAQQAQAQLQQAHTMIQQLTAALNKLSQKMEAKLPEIASRERIALLNAKAGIIEAALKAQSQEAIAAFEQDIAQIDRQLALMPDPGMETGSQNADPQQPQQPQAA
jgi:Phage P22-like portal protein